MAGEVRILQSAEDTQSSIDVSMNFMARMQIGSGSNEVKLAFRVFCNLHPRMSWTNGATE